MTAPPRTVTRLHAQVYRMSGGRVGGRMAGQPVLLLETVGRRSGQRRTSPVQYLAHDDEYVVVAANGGAPRPPAWWLNVRADPCARVTIGGATFDAVARTATGDERTALWRRLTAGNPHLQRAASAAQRELPVVVLERTNDGHHPAPSGCSSPEGRDADRSGMWHGLLAAALVVHNIEEAALIGRWQPSAGRWRHPVSPGAFRFAVAVVTVEGLVLVEMSRRAPANSRRRGLASGLSVLLLGNVAAPHLAATLARRRYSPGVVTAVAINLPVTVGVLRHGVRNGWFDRAAVKASSALVLGGVVAELPVLFSVGKRLAR